MPKKSRNVLMTAILKTDSSTRSDLTRGYTAALASAAILSTTAVFIRYLTQTYRLPESPTRRPVLPGRLWVDAGAL